MVPLEAEPTLVGELRWDDGWGGELRRDDGDELDVLLSTKQVCKLDNEADSNLWLLSILFCCRELFFFSSSSILNRSINASFSAFYIYQLKKK